MSRTVTTAPHASPEPQDKWHTLGKAVLAFHPRVGVSVMCGCGRTVFACEVQHIARRLGLLPPLR